MTKGYCKCGAVIDQVEFYELGMCLSCYKAKDKCIGGIKVKNMIVYKGNSEYHYICTSCKWNYWLNRYYPYAELTMTVEHMKGVRVWGIFHLELR